MAEWVKTPAAKPDDLSSSSIINIVEEDIWTDSNKLSSDLHTHAMVHTRMHRHDTWIK